MTMTDADSVTRTTTRRRQKRQQPPPLEMLNEHATREFMEIDKRKLIVPVTDYQRDESQGRIASDIAVRFDKVAFGVLLVIKRENGELAVADGGTRLSAANRRNDITTVPCIVFSGLTDKQESEVFLRVNVTRRKLQTEQQHHAELFSEWQLAITTERHIQDLRGNGITFDSLSTMRSCVKTDAVAIDTIKSILCSSASGKHLTSRVLKGLFRFEVVLKRNNKTLRRPKTIARMQQKFDHLDAAVNAVIKPRSTGNALDMARAVARTLNIPFPKV